MKTGWIDAHAHLADPEFTKKIKEVIDRAKAADIIRICLIVSELDQFSAAKQLSREYPELFDIAVGIHPTEVKNSDENDFMRLESLLDDEKIVAIGEIGLDYHWDKDNKEQQQQAFIRQIELANRKELPIQIHSRDALQDTLDIVRKYRVNRGGIMHCYSGSAEMAIEFIKAGLDISLGGPLTFKNATYPKEVVSRIPLEHLMSETDSPYLTPHPFRGKPNESMYVSYVGKMIAEIKGISDTICQKQIIENYKRIFKPKNFN